MKAQDTMLALVKKRAEPGLWLEEIPLPAVGKNDVLVKIRKTSICGTDVHIYQWNDWAQRTITPGITIGHEFAGEIAGLGENVNGFKIGERVSGEGHIVCGFCRNCLAGRRHLCQNTQGIGVNRNGAFAEYLTIPSSNVWHCPQDIPDDIVSCYDPLGNATHTALTYDLVGEDVLITGAGPIGTMAAAVCRHVGARYVVITDINDYRLELASRMGATHAININRTSIASIMQTLKMKEGFDVGLEMSGSPAAFSDMIEAMFHGGKIAMLGIPEASMTIDWRKVVFNSLTIKGIYGREMFETWYKMTTMLQSGLDISTVITHRLPARDFAEGFAIMSSGQSGKIILDWEQIH